jgi:hypothetical protein
MKQTRKTTNKRTLLMRKVWKLFSEYIRKRDKGQCFTCPVKRDYKEMQGGHFIHGKSTPIYFNEFNVHCQCPKCNLYLSGNRDVYLRNIQLKYGIEKGDWLMSQRFKVHRYSIKELEEIIENYKNKLKEL